MDLTQAFVPLTVLVSVIVAAVTVAFAAGAAWSQSRAAALAVDGLSSSLIRLDKQLVRFEEWSRTIEDRVARIERERESSCSSQR